MEMFRLCTPRQIEIAYETYQGYDPNWVAGLVLRGRFGFKKGIKKARKAPAPQKGEADCRPKVAPEQAQQLLEAYLASE